VSPQNTTSVHFNWNAPITSQDLINDPIGTYPLATVACFDPTHGDLPRRRLDGERTVKFLEELARAGTPAVLIAASTGHGHLRTLQELDEWLQAAARANLGECMKMALLRPEDGAEANEELIARLSELAYAVALVRPGTDLPAGASDEQVAANMRPIVAQAARRGLAVGVYSIPDVSGTPLSATAAAMLVHGDGGDHIVAAKITEADYEASTRRYLEHPDLEHLKIVEGWDPHLARALREGGQRCGVTSGPMSLAVFQYLHIFSAAAREDWDEVAAAQSAVTALFASMQDDPRKFADLQRAKFIMGLGQPLTSTVSAEQVARIFAALQSLPRQEDRARLARSLDLMGDGPFHERLAEIDA
jgi:dihydrodipicolinate synthase/N-acetylneuraminate lyase